MKASFCISLGARTLQGLGDRIQESEKYQPDLLEVRVDHLESFNPKALAKILEGYRDRCILTCRSPGEGGLFKGSEEKRLEILEKLIELKPATIDMEAETLRRRTYLAQEARSLGIKVIASWHSFNGTPPKEALLERVRNTSNLGDIVKIVTMARSIDDNIKLLELYREMERGRLLAFCMGEKGLLSRILSLQLGAPFTYVSLPSEATAPGQIPIDLMRRLLHALE